MSSHMNNFSMAATQGSNPSSVSSSSSSAAACNSKRTHHHHHHHGSDSHIQFIEQNLQQIEQERNKVLEECGALKAQVQWMKGRQEALERQLADSSQKIGLERAQSLDLQSNCKKLSSEVQHLKEKLSRNQMLTEKLLKEKSELYKQMTTEYVPVQSHDMSKKECEEKIEQQMKIIEKLLSEKKELQYQLSNNYVEKSKYDEVKRDLDHNVEKCIQLQKSEHDLNTSYLEKLSAERIQSQKLQREKESLQMELAKVMEQLKLVQAQDGDNNEKINKLQGELKHLHTLEYKVQKYKRKLRKAQKINAENYNNLNKLYGKLYAAAGGNSALPIPVPTLESNGNNKKKKTSSSSNNNNNKAGKKNNGKHQQQQEVDDEDDDEDDETPQQQTSAGQTAFDAQLLRMNDRINDLQFESQQLRSENIQLKKFAQQFQFTIEELETRNKNDQAKLSLLKDEVGLRDKEIEKRDKFIHSFMEPSQRPISKLQSNNNNN